MLSRIRIDDLIILGQSSPDTMKDGRLSVCTGGYSPTHGFIRLYPTRMDSSFRMWDIVSVSVERNPQDARAESWKIHGSKAEWESLGDKITVRGSLPQRRKLPLIESLLSGCVFDIRDQGRSLGVVRPVDKECYFAQRERFDPYDQMTLDDRLVPKDKSRYRLRPRARFSCANCRSEGGHDQQILEWGVYEWMRKNPGKEDLVWDNLFSRESKQEIFFLVGNLARHPLSFMIISVLRIRRL